MGKWLCVIAFVLFPALGCFAAPSPPARLSVLLYPVSAPADLPAEWAALTQELLLSGLRAQAEPRVAVSLFDSSSAQARRLVQDWSFLDARALRAGEPDFVFVLGEEMGLDAVLVCRLEAEGQGMLVSGRLMSVRNREICTYLAGARPEAADNRAQRGALRSAITRLLRDVRRDLLTAGQAPAATVEEYLRRGRDLRAQGRLTEAVRQYHRALALSPKSLPAALEQAECYLEQGDARGARLAWRRASALAEQDAQVQLLGARLDLAAGRLHEAEARCRALLAAAPADGIVRRQLAEILLAEGRQAEAADLLEAVLASRPEDQALLTKLGGICRRLGRLDQAVGHYRALLALAPGDAAARDSLIQVLLAQDDVPAAVREYRVAFEMATQPVSYPDDAYLRLAALFDREAQTLLASGRKLLEAGQTPSPDDRALAALLARSDNLAKAATHVVPPPGLRSQHNLRLFAYSLLSQSDFEIGRYLQGGDRQHYDRAIMLREAAAITLRKAAPASAAAG